MIDDISIKLVEEFELAFNRHGNFVLYVLQHGSEEQRCACTYVRTNVVRYSMHKLRVIWLSSA